MLSRQQTSEFLAFKERSKQLLEQNPNLRRMDCLNPVKAIKHDFDFSHISAIDPMTAWRKYLKVTFNQATFSLGIRDSLGRIFRHLQKTNRRISIPQDTYPVYQMLAAESGVATDLYSAVPSFDLQQHGEVTLITAPSVPSGYDLTEKDVQLLLLRLQESKDRLLIIDRVYDYNNDAVIQPLIDSDQVIVCYSLSKTFLSPLMMGLNIVNEDWKEVLEQPAPAEAAKAAYLLSAYSDFPAEQQSRFKYRWEHLKSVCNAPQTGYLTLVQTENVPADVLRIPGEVYGISNDYSVLSCLHESNAESEDEDVILYHVTVLSNFARGFDKYSRTYSKDGISESRFKDRFYLLEVDELHIGFQKTRKLLEKMSPHDRPIVLRTEVKKFRIRPNLTTGLGVYVEGNQIELDGVLNEELE